MAQTTESGTATTVGSAAQAILAGEHADNLESPEAQDQAAEEHGGVDEAEGTAGDHPEESGVEGEEAGAESDEQDADEGQSDESESEEPDTEYVTVKVNGEEKQVTLDELKNGYSRDADYRRKTQELAEQRKTFEAEHQQVQQERQQYAQLLDRLKQQVEQQAEREPDWDRLWQENPAEWVRQKELHRDRKEKQQAIEQEQQRLSEQQEQEQQQHIQQVVQREQEALLEALPEWKDKDTAKAERKQVLEAGKGLGYTEEELAQVYDHRAIVALRKAAKYDELMANRSKVKPGAGKGSSKTAEPGASTSAKTQKRQASRKVRERAAQTGSVRDAAAAIQQTLRKG